MIISEPTPPPHGKQVYPWEKWADGKGHWVSKGQHFQQTAVKFRNMLFAAARRQGMEVKTRVNGNRVWFQFLPATEKSSTKRKGIRK